MALPQEAKKAVDEATASCERVTDRARTITDVIANRKTRARTNPFIKVEDSEFEQDDSMVTSIEKVISTQSNAAIEVKKEE